MTKQLSINYLNKGNDSVVPTPREKTPTIKNGCALKGQNGVAAYNISNLN